MSQLVNAKVWDGSEWVPAVDPSPPTAAAWFETVPVTFGAEGSSGVITADASNNVKGSWVQLFASTSGDATALFVTFFTQTVYRAFLADIGVGASGSEVVIAENIPAGYGISTSATAPYSGRDNIIPVAVPAGSRIAVRVQCEVGGSQIGCQMSLANGGSSASAVDTLGADASNSGGVVVSSNNTWTEIIASTANAYRAVSPVPAPRTNTLPNITETLVEVGYGPSGSEVSVGGVRYRITTSEVVTRRSPSPAWLPAAIPAGSRIAVRTATASSVVDFAVLAAR